MTEINLCQIRLRYQLSVVFCQIRQGLSKLTKTTGFYVTNFPSATAAAAAAAGELINSLLANFKSVTRVAITKCGNYCYCVFVSENDKGWCERWSTTVCIYQYIIQAGGVEAVFLATGNDTLIAVTWTLSFSLRFARNTSVT